MESDKDNRDGTPPPSTSSTDTRKRVRSVTPERVKRKRGESSSKEKHRKQRYRPDWEKNPEFKEWLRPAKGDPFKAYCCACNSTFTAELVVIKNHAKSKPHASKAKAITVQPKISQILLDKTKQNFDDQVKIAEIRTCALVAENNFSFKSVDAIVSRDKACYPDSKIAQNVKLGHTKANCIVKYVIGKHENDVLSDKLKSRKFSIIIDESTDIGTIKNLCVCVRFSDEGKIVTKFWRLVQVFASNDFEAASKGATASRLYDALIKSLDDAEIPKQNVIGFASDGCNTMFGENNSVAQRLNENFPGLTLSKCICHSLHICSSEACKELPRAPEELARDIYNFFKSSNKRQSQFVEFQKFFEVDVHKILRPSQTRWLSLQLVVDRILEQWVPLLNFFELKASESKQVSVANIVRTMKDPTTKLYFEFLQWILPKFVGLNRLFQGDSALIATVYDAMSESYKEVLLSFMDRKYVIDTDLHKIDPGNAEKFLPLSQIYLGVSLMNLENNPLIKGNKDAVEITTYFRKRCRQFLVKICQETRNRFDFSKDSPYAKLRCLHRKIATSVEDPRRPQSIIDLAETVPRIINPSDTARLQKIDDQWRKMQLREFPMDLKEMKNDEFWKSMEDFCSLNGEKEFRELSIFALDVLALPFSNVACERVFSKVNLMKTKTRNKLSTKTVNGLLLTSQHVSTGGGTSKFKVSQSMLSYMASKNLYRNKDRSESLKSVSGVGLMDFGDESESDEDVVFQD